MIHTHIIYVHTYPHTHKHTCSQTQVYMILSDFLPVQGEHRVLLQWDILLLYLSSGPVYLGSLHLTPGLPRQLSSKESACKCRRHGFNSWVAKIPWRRKWQPTPVFLPGKSHRQRSLDGYSICGHRARHYLMTKQHLIQVYYYPRAVRAKKYHKPSDLKQHECIILQLWRAEA